MGKYEKINGSSNNRKSNVQSLANKTKDGNVELLASKMNDFFVSVSEHLPRLDRNNEAFDVDGQLPDEYVIDLTTTLQVEGDSTTDALVEMIHRWSEATDKLDHYVRVALLDFSKAFDLINHNTLLVKLKQYGLPPHIRRWIATFLLDTTQQVKIGNNFSPPGHPKGGEPQGTLLGLKCFLVYINDLETPAPLYKYVYDSTLFEI